MAASTLVEFDLVYEDESLICHICLSLFENPQRLECCSKHICKNCIDNLKGSICPFCRTKPVRYTASLELRMRVFRANVWCVNKRHGCPWNGELRLLGAHRFPDNPNPMAGCAYQEVRCPHEGCREKVVRWNLIRHEVLDCPASPLHMASQSSGRSKKEADVIRTHTTTLRKVTSMVESQTGRLQEMKKDLEIHEQASSSTRRRVDAQEVDLNDLKRRIGSLEEFTTPPTDMIVAGISTTTAAQQCTACESLIKKLHEMQVEVEKLNAELTEIRTRPIPTAIPVTASLLMEKKSKKPRAEKSASHHCVCEENALQLRDLKLQLDELQIKVANRVVNTQTDSAKTTSRPSDDILQRLNRLEQSKQAMAASRRETTKSENAKMSKLEQRLSSLEQRVIAEQRRKGGHRSSGGSGNCAMNHAVLENMRTEMFLIWRAIQEMHTVSHNHEETNLDFIVKRFYNRDGYPVVILTPTKLSKNEVFGLMLKCIAACVVTSILFWFFLG